LYESYVHPMISGADYYKYQEAIRHEICALVWPIPVYTYSALLEISMFCEWGLHVFLNY